jgi:hypothetical protein
MPGVPELVPLLADELANALLDRRDRHRHTGSVLPPVSTHTQMILHCAVHTPPGNLGPAARQTSDLRPTLDPRAARRYGPRARRH